MDVTSNHLDVVARGGFGWREDVDDGEEIARRSENFGHPVGKSTYDSFPPPYRLFFFQFHEMTTPNPHPELRMTQVTPLHSQYSYARSGRVKSLGYAVLQKR